MSDTVGGNSAPNFGSLTLPFTNIAFGFTSRPNTAFNHSIRVNSVHPGPIYTSLMSNYGITEEQAADPVNVTLPPHIGESSDIGYGILYLASDEAKFVTGEELIIDGGYATH